MTGVEELIGEDGCEDPVLPVWSGVRYEVVDGVLVRIEDDV